MITLDTAVSLLLGTASPAIIKGYQNAHKIQKYRICGVYFVVFDTQRINQYRKVNRALSHVQKEAKNALRSNISHAIKYVLVTIIFRNSEEGGI